MMWLMQKRMLQVVITLCAAGSAVMFAQDPRVPIENDSVKVLKVPVNPLDKTKLHEHKANRVMIYLQAGKQNIEYQDGKKVVLTFKPSQALWSPQAGMHIAEIISDKPVTIVEIELKKPAPATKPAAS